MPIPPVTPAPQKVPDITQQDFANRLLKPTGDGNRKLGLGNLVSNRPEQRDLTNDGVAEWIYSFSSGQKLIVVSNMNAWGVTGTRQEPITKKEIVDYKPTREWISTGTEPVYETHTPDTCPEKERLLEAYNRARDRAKIYVDDNGNLQGSIFEVNQAQKAYENYTCPTTRTKVDEKETGYWDEGEEPIYKEVPTGRTRTVDVYGYMADFGNLDGDPKTPETWIANIVWGDDPATRNIENEVRRAVVVVGNPPPKRVDQDPAPIILDDKN